MRQGIGRVHLSGRVGALLGLLIGLTGWAGASAPVASAQSCPVPLRVQGADRFATALDAWLADADGPPPTKAIVLTTGLNFPDGLAGSYLAGLLSPRAAILLTNPDSLPTSVFDAIQANGVTRVVILGTQDAVGQGVEDQLAALPGVLVTRVGGATRYDTMEQIDTMYGASVVGTDATGEPTAIVADGLNFPDELSAGPLAFARHFPIVLSDPSGLTTQAREVLVADHIGHVIIAGGTAAVSQAVSDQIQAMGITIDREAGSDRSVTSADLAIDEINNYGFSKSHFGIATGTNFPDALAAGPYEGFSASALTLTVGGNDAGSAFLPFRSDLTSSTAYDIFGESDVVPNSVTESLCTPAGP